MSWILAIAAASGAPASSSLSWVRLDGAESCVAAPELAAEIEARLGRPVFRAPAEAELQVEGRAEPGDGEVRWRAVLRLTDHAGAVLGDRVVESRAASCDELGHVVAVTVALMIDPELAPESPPAPRWSFDVVGALTGGWGLVPGVTAGGSATLVATPPGFLPVLVTGELVPFGRDAVGIADFSRATGGLALCPLRVGDRARLLGCLGVDAGAIFAVRSAQPLNAGEWVLVQGRGSLRGGVAVWGPLTVNAAVHLVVPFRAVVFTTTAGAEVYRPPPVAGLLDLGVGVRF